MASAASVPIKVKDVRSLTWKRLASDRNRIVFKVEVTILKETGMQVMPSWRCGATKMMSRARTITFSGKMTSINFVLNRAAAITIAKQITVPPTKISVKKAVL